MLRAAPWILIAALSLIPSACSDPDDAPPPTAAVVKGDPCSRLPHDVELLDAAPRAEWLLDSMIVHIDGPRGPRSRYLELRRRFDALPRAEQAAAVAKRLARYAEGYAKDDETGFASEDVAKVVSYNVIDDDIALACCSRLEDLLACGPLRVRLKVAGSLFLLYVRWAKDELPRLCTHFCEGLAHADGAIRRSALDELEFFAAMVNHEVIARVYELVETRMGEERLEGALFLGRAAEGHPTTREMIDRHRDDAIVVWGYLKGIARAEGRLSRVQAEHLSGFTSDRRVAIRRALVSALGCQPRLDVVNDALKTLERDPDEEIRETARVMRSMRRRPEEPRDLLSPNAFTRKWDPFGKDEPPR